MVNSPIIIAIMAGGLGKRMNSEIPKVLHMLGNLPIIIHVIRSAIGLVKAGEDVIKILIIVGKHASVIEMTINKYLGKDELKYIEYVMQDPPQGTGHAVQQILPYLLQYSSAAKVMILSGDVPLIKTKTLLGLLATYDFCNKAIAVVVTTIMDDPSGNGRIIRDGDGYLIKIIEEKDATEREKLIKDVNAGIYLFHSGNLMDNLPKIRNNNAQKEYYLPDVLPLLTETGGKIVSYIIDKEDQYELLNINNQENLREAEIHLRL